MKTWKDPIESNKLGSIANVYNGFFLPNVFCPWEYSKFIHHVGYLDIETVLQQFIQKCKLSVIDSDKRLKVEHSRDDFVRESLDDYDMWLYNCNWKILPTIVFVNGYPRVLTCKGHNGGCNLTQVHCCRWR